MKVPRKVLNKTFELEDAILDIIDELKGNDLEQTKGLLKDKKYLGLWSLSIKDLALYRNLTLEIIDENFENIKALYYKIENRDWLPKIIEDWLNKDWSKE